MLLLAVVYAATATDIDTLVCATNVTVQGTNVPNDDPDAEPKWEMSETTIPVEFDITDTDLDELHYLKIDTTEVTVTGYQSDRETTVGKVLTWADLLAGSAIAEQPRDYTGCQVVGCDGFKLATLPFMQLFNQTVKYLVFSFTLNFYPVTTQAANRVQTAPPAGSKLEGTTVVGLNLTATRAIFNRAFGLTSASSSSSTLSTGAIVGIAAGSVAGLVLICLALYACNSQKRETYMATTERMAGKPAATVTARYGNAHVRPGRSSSRISI